ncbi:MAG TPA: Gfo/Idh/MocA family oxidoreductase [Afifellaceae bacterium]|nr:Gfo/Idh/MocA family oxidoreductase [Afifellaceae bacterium]
MTIVGGGRWGRVWADVIAAARGGGECVTMVARQNTGEVRRWAGATPALRGMAVVDSIGAAFAVPPRASMAIIASRPRDHARDGIEALANGAHVLVEKPIAGTAAEADALIQTAGASSRLLGVGTEFALHPAMHHFAASLRTADARSFSAALDWIDPRGESRHGLQKARHDEVTVLHDLLPHAISVFRVLRPAARFELVEGQLWSSGRGGTMRFRDQWRSEYSLSCDADGDQRRRLLQIRSDGECGTVDFAQHPARLAAGGRSLRSPAAVRRLDSTLRLELGAFAAQIAGAIQSSPLTSGLRELVNLQAALEALGDRASLDRSLTI